MILWVPQEASPNRVGVVSLLSPEDGNIRFSEVFCFLVIGNSR
jgi:hypothetical protein